MENSTDEKTFEEGYKELEEIVTKLESGKADLQTAMDLYKQGRGLADRCRKQLEDAELMIRDLETGEETAYNG